MAYNLGLLPNEAILLKETDVAHGGIMAAYTDELIVTNMHLICVKKGILGNTKGIEKFPLKQIKVYNGKPQAMQGKLSNGTPALEVYFVDGKIESFWFQSSHKKKIGSFIKAIYSAFGAESLLDDELSGSSADGLIGTFMDVGEEFVGVGKELLGAFGIKAGEKRGGQSSLVMVNKKCVSCSAPLSGQQGETIKCKYCDTVQTL